LQITSHDSNKEGFPDVERDTRSGCPIATTLDIVGDRWTLVVLRDLLTGKSRFNQFLGSPERITTNVLTDRLDMMERAGLVTKAPYQDRPKRMEYSLTRKGESLLPVMQEMCRWANAHIPGTWTPPASFMKRKVR
jgi:DNA-binding HxlR family transcriptional regulator